MIETEPEHYSLDPAEPVYFYGGPFSSFADYPISLGLNQLHYATREHWFQAHKAVSHGQHELIRKASSPAEAKALGRQTKLRPNWDLWRYDFMLSGLRLQLNQHETLAELLVATLDRPIAEDSSTDAIWGIRDGDAFSGMNLLGICLMEARYELLGVSNARLAALEISRSTWPDWPETLAELACR